MRDSNPHSLELVPKTSVSTNSTNWAINGAGTRTRTADLLITNQLLYQLSYAGLLSILSKKFGADDEVRTRDIQIGNLTLYQLSYIRLKNVLTQRVSSSNVSTKQT